VFDLELNPFELLESNPLPDVKDEWGDYSYSYEDLLKSITDKVEWLVEGGYQDYQGDFYYFGKDQQGAFYFVVGGYGSCSGCDALQACDTYEDLIELRSELKRSIRKFDSLEEFEGWFNNDAQTEWYNDEDIEDFIEKANSRFPFVLKWRQD